MRWRLAIALVALAAGACGKPAVLDVPRSEARIADRLEEAYAVDGVAVSCPDDVEVEDGSTFRCTAEVEETTLDVDVRQTDDDGTLEVEAQAAIIVTSRVETDIAETLADRFERDDVEVTCEGPAVRAEEPDATFACEAVDGDETKEVEVRVRDARGALAYTLG